MYFYDFYNLKNLLGFELYILQNCNFLTNSLSAENLRNKTVLSNSREMLTNEMAGI